MMNPIDKKLIFQKKFPTKRKKNGLCASAVGSGYTSTLPNQWRYLLGEEEGWVLRWI